MIPISMVSCFFCGVDSQAGLLFFIMFVCSMVGGAFLILIWAVTRGDFKNIETPKHDPFKHLNEEI